MTKSRRAASVIEATGSAFFDLFEPAEAGRRIGTTQPRVSDLLRGRLDKFSIDALIVYLVRVAVQVRIDTSTPKRRRRAG
jgi:Helix-turn-helix domain